MLLVHDDMLRVDHFNTVQQTILVVIATEYIKHVSEWTAAMAFSDNIHVGRLWPQVICDVIFPHIGELTFVDRVETATEENELVLKVGEARLYTTEEWSGQL